MLSALPMTQSRRFLNGARVEVVGFERRLAAQRAEVTVVVTNRDYGAFVRGAVTSALNQTLPAEVVVIDDGSSDGSAAILAELESTVRVSVLRLPRVGIASARNAGLRRAATDWVVFLDADDLLEPDFLASTWAAWRAAADPSIAFVYGDVTLFGAETGVVRSRGFSRRSLALGNYVANSCLLDRRAALDVGGYSEDLELGHEDWDLFLALSARGFTGLHVPAPLLRYRRHVAGSRNTRSVAQLDEVRSLLRERHPSVYRGLTGWLGGRGRPALRLATRLRAGWRARRRPPESLV